MVFSHHWLSESFTQESRKQALHDESTRNFGTKKHHYVPRFYLKRWANPEGESKMTIVDSGSSYVQPVEQLARKTNFNRFSADDIDPVLYPALWVEKHMSRIEDQIAIRLTEACATGPGPVNDPLLKADIAVFVGLQYVRGVKYRKYALKLDEKISTLDPLQLRQTVSLLLPTLLPTFGISYDPSRHEEQLEDILSKSTSSGSSDPRVKALDQALSDLRVVVSDSVHKRLWAIYATVNPIVTCDEPVIMIPGGKYDRSRWLGPNHSQAIIFPLDPHHLLVMLTRNLSHTEPFILDEEEAFEVNLEFVAGSDQCAFERPQDSIVSRFDIPPRRPARPVGSAPNLFDATRQPERWPEGAVPGGRSQGGTPSV
ncbi:DUF4238 domain-containing protein [Nocardia cyriacigeorgica]|uniref:DUF4238 domain-containing protein n=1 Tax=Nocardia cyriacigeorgica TaxID=135487 RepID=UPI0018941B83|nr:DUF4238 domain-containing protein [Nocardia cyriacigeorgica]MBF6436385.1 DUF4238 domain-containing protein [Nocardia cyriacigeorgica]